VKLEYLGVQLDILYCAMITPSHPPDDPVAYLQDYRHIGMDKANALSFMGWRTCKVMLGMIPDHDAFRWSLRIVKQWARNRGIYGFNFGYLNGISLVIMVIKAQQHLSRAAKAALDNTMPETPTESFAERQEPLQNRVNDLLQCFFHLFADWSFENSPIYIHQPHDQDLDMLEESQKSAFPVLTPVRPFQCTTFGTTASACLKIQEEFKRARDIQLTFNNLRGLKDYMLNHTKHTEARSVSITQFRTIFDGLGWNQLF